MGMGIWVSVITTQPSPELTTWRKNIPPWTALAENIQKLCQSSSEICNSCSLISKTLNEYFYFLIIQAIRNIWESVVYVIQIKYWYYGALDAKDINMQKQMDYRI